MAFPPSLQLLQRKPPPALLPSATASVICSEETPEDRELQAQASRPLPWQPPAAPASCGRSSASPSQLPELVVVCGSGDVGGSNSPQTRGSKRHCSDCTAQPSRALHARRKEQAHTCAPRTLGLLGGCFVPGGHVPTGGAVAQALNGRVAALRRAMRLHPARCAAVAFPPSCDGASGLCALQPSLSFYAGAGQKSFPGHGVVTQLPAHSAPSSAVQESVLPTSEESQSTWFSSPSQDC